MMARKTEAKTIFRKPLGHLVQALYHVPKEEVTKALEIQSETGGRLGDILVNTGAISEEQLEACLAILSRNESTVLSHGFLSPLLGHWWARHLQLTLEGFFFVALSIAIVYALGVQEGGLISMFLCGAALATRFNLIMLESTGRSKAVDIMALFVGIFVAYISVALIIEMKHLHWLFGFVMDAANLHAGSTIETRNFSDFTGILFHNCMVLLTVFWLAFIYRSYGGLLVLSWNACVWGLTLTLLIRQSFGFSDADSLVSVVIAWVAVLPHLGFEAWAYIVGALNAIGISKALFWHRPFFRKSNKYKKQFYIDMRRNLKGLGITLILVVVAAAIESTWAPFVLDYLKN